MNPELSSELYNLEISCRLHTSTWMFKTYSKLNISNVGLMIFPTKSKQNRNLKNVLSVLSMFLILVGMSCHSFSGATEIGFNISFINLTS